MNPLEKKVTALFKLVEILNQNNRELSDRVTKLENPVVKKITKSKKQK